MARDELWDPVSCSFLESIAWSTGEAIAKYAYENAHDKSKGECAKYCRQAIESEWPFSDLDLKRQPSAYLYGSSLEDVGFSKVTTVDAGKAPPGSFKWRPGDVVIIGRSSTRKHGHMEIYTGYAGKGKFASDFKQFTAMPYYDGGEMAIYRYLKMLG